MKTTRRSLLKTSALGGMAAALTGCERMTSQIAGLLGEALSLVFPRATLSGVGLFSA